MGNEYTVGKQLTSWNGGNAQSLTFIVTEDCNLRCKYCYITHKCSNKRMSFEVAKKFIDYVFDGDFRLQEAVTLDFIGGEPLLEIELIDKICDYFKLKSFLAGSSWYWNYRISICTNGVNYLDKRIQDFIKKNEDKVGITITIDGIKEKHDLQRVFPDGSGSYDVIKKNVDIWKHQFVGSTKVTFASDDLKYLKDSVIGLWNEGIPEVAANVVFEDVWKDGDDEIFENQLKELADYILDNGLQNENYCTLFDDSIGQPYTEEDLKQTSCGAGKMIAVGVDGKLFPCMRYCAYSLNEKEEYSIGNVDEGIDFDKVRPFQVVTYDLQSDSECLNCSIAKGCSFCQGFNYDASDSATNFQRAKYICKMHKARVRANNYYFNKLFNRYGIERENYTHEKVALNFLLSNNYVNCCSQSNKGNMTGLMISMEKEMILDGLKYAKDHFYKPVFIHSKLGNDFIDCEEFEEYRILHIVPLNYYNEACAIYRDVLPVIDVAEVDEIVLDEKIDNIVLNFDKDSVVKISDTICKLWNKVNRFNINILDLDYEFDLKKYENELLKVKEMIVEDINKKGVLQKEVNILTDELLLEKHENCGAGDKNITLGPDGNLYICPAFYSDDTEEPIGHINQGETNIKNAQLYTQEYAPLCNMCDAFHCADCVYHNKKRTNEVNIPSAVQCKKSHIEKRVAKMIQDECKEKILFAHEIKEESGLDPIKKVIDRLDNRKLGFYPM
ncbi:radical SAM peptide maturase, CXXX-repeat target family [Butyrivibrio sp. AE2005]|uniref:radical SAM peptide maturase, CXXX-repeat target family n=1 Tax=Butyrivibrio sp. AE2005 TaxID=1496722 RepID=UPI00047DAAB9|nr:radical SAM peptide maturase, CXXX-repeat target family [Butyrivibrio sp. AE2005]